MLHLKNIERYIPDHPPKEWNGLSVIYFKDEEGKDFYQTVPDFQNDTMKVLYSKENSITGFSTDASTFYPAGASLVELPLSEVPEDLALGENFIIDPVTLKISKNATAILAQEKEKAMFTANREIDALQDLIDTDMATEEDLSAMKAWKMYRVNVRQAETLEALPLIP